MQYEIDQVGRAEAKSIIYEEVIYGGEITDFF
jgi:hypothetical protein